MKKILISNNCFAASIYKDCVQVPQPSPFCWNIIQSEDFTRLIKNIDTIDFLNFKVAFDELCGEYYVLIDNLVRVYYTHYKYDENAETPYIGFVDGYGDMIYSNRIIEFISEKYVKRVKRLIETRENEGVEYIFYYDAGCFRPWLETRESYVSRRYNELLALSDVTKYNICVSHWEWDFLDELKAKNDKFLFIPKPYRPDGTIFDMDSEVKYMYENYLKDILEQ